MKSILERLRQYFGRAKTHDPYSFAEGAASPPTPELTPDIRSAPYDPYAEMRRVLATTILLG